MPSVYINWWALLAAALVNVVIGCFWYSKTRFGINRAKAGGRGQACALIVIGSLVQVWVLVHFVRYSGALDFARGAEIGFFLWLGFAATTGLAFHAFEGRPWRLWQINAGYSLAVLLINGGLLAAWR